GDAAAPLLRLGPGGDFTSDYYASPDGRLVTADQVPDRPSAPAAATRTDGIEFSRGARLLGSLLSAATVLADHLSALRAAAGPTLSFRSVPASTGRVRSERIVVRPIHVPHPTLIEGPRYEPHPEATPHPAAHPGLPPPAWLFADHAGTRRPD